MDITKDNLIIAYKKLKHYLYYYSTNYLKNKLISFEKQVIKNSGVFEELADKLNKKAENLNNCYSNNEIDINFVVYPKKNKIDYGKNNDKLIANEVNIFVDMSLEYHLLDVLFATSLYETFRKYVNLESVFGNIFDSKLNPSNILITIFYLRIIILVMKNGNQLLFQ